MKWISHFLFESKEDSLTRFLNYRPSCERYIYLFTFTTSWIPQETHWCAKNIRMHHLSHSQRNDILRTEGDDDTRWDEMRNERISFAYFNRPKKKEKKRKKEKIGNLCRVSGEFQITISSNAIDSSHGSWILYCSMLHRYRISVENLMLNSVFGTRNTEMTTILITHRWIELIKFTDWLRPFNWSVLPQLKDTTTQPTNQPTNQSAHGTEPEFRMWRIKCAWAIWAMWARI